MYDSLYPDTLIITCGQQECALDNQTNSRQEITNCGLVKSSQSGLHPRLETLVLKHMKTEWKQPLHTPSVEAYRRLSKDVLPGSDLPIILDSGCGTGESTQNLAILNPRHLVLGVDQSLNRLSRSGMTSDFLRIKNCILLRAELSTFWRLFLADGLTPERHCLFYPNPWPKPGHFLRRWHGHPVFPQLLALGGVIELRCNWEIYAQEFAQAVRLATGAVLPVKVFKPEAGITPFERKYLERDHSLYSVTVPTGVPGRHRMAVFETKKSQSKDWL